jgi:phosphoribosylanthranilate isomerase
MRKPFILAGGLGPGNVLNAIEKVKPCGVDLNSRLEISPGVKDHRLMEETIRIIRSYQLTKMEGRKDE